MYGCKVGQGGRPWTGGAVAVVLVSALAGCTQQRRGIVEPLPEPVFGARPVEAPTPRPIAPEPLPSRRVVPRPGRVAEWMPPGGLSRRWECIVIHHSATATGCASQFDAAHKKRGWDGLGYHFVIGNGTDTPNGRVEVGERWRQQKHGAHCKTADNFYNDHGIGICLVGDFEKSVPSRAQMDSLVRLVSFLTAECDIPSDRVYSHGGVTGKTACPGRRFSLGTLKAQLARQSPRAALSRR